MLTITEVKTALPTHLKNLVDQPFVDKINNACSDPLVAEQIRDNYLSYTKVLSDGKYKTEDYLNAVMYVSYKLMNMSNQDAYFRTFPNRHAALVAKGTSSKDISAYVSAYAKGKLVNAILEQTLIPTWVLNQDLYQKALNVQADLMVNAQSEMVRTTAANSILTQLQKPKETGPLINFDMRETEGMSELKGMLIQVAQAQRQAIAAGSTAKDIAALPLIEGEATRVP